MTERRKSNHVETRRVTEASWDAEEKHLGGFCFVFDECDIHFLALQLLSSACLHQEITARTSAMTFDLWFPLIKQDNRRRNAAQAVSSM